MPVVELQSIGKTFGAVRALDGVDLRLEAGEALGLVGDNGAGKSTLVRILAGNFPPSDGSIVVDGREIQLRRPLDARREGIEVVYQDLALCDNLSAAENVFLGRELRRRALGLIPSIDAAEMERRAAEIFSSLGADVAPRSPVAELSGGQRQAVAIARTRLSDPKAVLLDEPTAAIGVRQVQEVLELIRRLKEQGIAVVLVSHRFDDVFAVCDRVCVLRRGRKIAERFTEATTHEEITGLVTGAIEA